MPLRARCPGRAIVCMAEGGRPVKTYWCLGWLVTCALALVFWTPSGAGAQEFPKPGPEHEILKKLVGEWDTTVRFGKDESKGTATYKLECGGLWLVSNF